MLFSIFSFSPFTAFPHPLGSICCPRGQHRERELKSLKNIKHSEIPEVNKALKYDCEKITLTMFDLGGSLVVILNVFMVISRPSV